VPVLSGDPYPRANGEHTIDVLRRLRAAFPDEALIVLWDGAPYHRAKVVREAARALGITLMPLPGSGFKWSSQHGLCELFGGTGPEPRPVFASPGSFAACC